MAGYIGSKSSVTLVDGYTEAEADAEFVNDPNDVITVSGSNSWYWYEFSTNTLDLDILDYWCNRYAALSTYRRLNRTHCNGVEISAGSSTNFSNSINSKLVLRI